ncbi:hypothetical protein [Nostoc sp. 'Peltigera malacea cyanobiont' DB3992]|uniref:hypothetical protein n=1 Tax=Nostoc sp. 'Peltigera malacea cyanobiont' DB3992 TaxID=1206980 RepID=UPI0015D5086A|nr:hypothetical protein [Nostoc sp. 'Peltigera malacea cyanobiont' DB3992]
MALVAFYGCRTTGTRTKQRCLRRAIRRRNLEFIVISQPPSHGDKILSDIIESSPS